MNSKPLSDIQNFMNFGLGIRDCGHNSLFNLCQFYCCFNLHFSDNLCDRTAIHNSLAIHMSCFLTVLLKIVGTAVLLRLLTAFHIFYKYFLSLFSHYALFKKNLKFVCSQIYIYFQLLGFQTFLGSFFPPQSYINILFFSSNVLICFIFKYML